MIDFSEYDVLVVGCGLTGGVIARRLADSGKRVLVLERRNHIAGNLYDYTDEHGVLVQKYGPHIFHTWKKEIIDFVRQYEDWTDFRLECGVFMLGKYTPSPFNFSTIDEYYSTEKAAELKKRFREVYGSRSTVTIVEALDCADPMIAEYAAFLYANDYSLYTAKQWGIAPEKVDVSVLRRVPIRLSYDTGYFDDEYQVMPLHSFTRFFENLLDSERITVKLGENASEHLSPVGDVIRLNGCEKVLPVVFTGALDELFGYVYGRLPYRSLRFEHIHTENESTYPVTVYPAAKDFTRITNFNMLSPHKAAGNTSVVEYPFLYSGEKGTEPFYPVLTAESADLYDKYRKMADDFRNLTYCGRLGSFRYYNMDQAIESALAVSDRLMANGGISNSF